MAARTPLLINFGGLPGVGKTSLAKVLAVRSGAMYLSLDTIRQALQSSGVSTNIRAASHIVAYRLAEENLRLGRGVVVDCVNPLRVTRDGWIVVAQATASIPLEIEITCSDLAEHRRRLETRHSYPSWQAVLDRYYEKWERPHLLLDTAGHSIEESTQELFRKLVLMGALDEDAPTDLGTCL